MILLRSALFQLLFYAATAALAVVFLPLLVFPGAWMMRAGTAWSALTLKLLELSVGLSFEVRGRENLPAGPVIIAMKHQSAWDTLAAPVIFDRPVIVLKRELGWIPFYGWYALKAGMIPIDRGAAATALRRMVARSARAVAERRPIIVFPEGTRTAPGAPPAYQPGIYALYRQLGLPLVPVALNSGLYWGRRSFRKRPGRIIVEILPAIPPGGERRIVMAALEAAIEGACANLPGGAPRRCG
ncbi:MAG TPA: lysophospholipid acyltransferase family protein [Stellaceae bacterium]|nr:lysophospholipid acyltransferase family protein [Stellaceae bacterium]